MSNQARFNHLKSRLLEEVNKENDYLNNESLQLDQRAHDNQFNAFKLIDISTEREDLRRQQERLTAVRKVIEALLNF